MPSLWDIYPLAMEAMNGDDVPHSENSPSSWISSPAFDIHYRGQSLSSHLDVP